MDFSAKFPFFYNQGGDWQKAMPIILSNTDVNHHLDEYIRFSLGGIELENVPSEHSSKSSTTSIPTPTLVEDVEALPEIPFHRPTGLKVRPFIEHN
jgi:hypothetical protein